MDFRIHGFSLFDITGDNGASLPRMLGITVSVERENGLRGSNYATWHIGRLKASSGPSQATYSQR